MMSSCSNHGTTSFMKRIWPFIDTSKFWSAQANLGESFQHKVDLQNEDIEKDPHIIVSKLNIYNNIIIFGSTYKNNNIYILYPNKFQTYQILNRLNRVSIGEYSILGKLTAGIGIIQPNMLMTSRSPLCTRCGQCESPKKETPSINSKASTTLWLGADMRHPSSSIGREIAIKRKPRTPQQKWRHMTSPNICASHVLICHDARWAKSSCRSGGSCPPNFEAHPVTGCQWLLPQWC